MNTTKRIENGFVSPPDEPTPTTRRINLFILGALVIIALGLGVILNWAFAGEDVLNVKNEPIPTRTIREHPTAGGVVFLNVDYCKNVDVEGDLRVSFVSTTREVFLPITKERGPKGCTKTEFPVLIPKDIPADTYEVKLRVIYDINPIKSNIIEEFKSQKVIIDPVTADNGLPPGTVLR